MKYSSLRTISTVIQREIAVALRTKSVLIMVAILFLAAIAAPIIINALGDDDEPSTIATVKMDEAAFADSPVEAVAAADRAEAEKLVDDGDADAALVPSEKDGWDLITDDGEANNTITVAAQQAVSTVANAEAFHSLGIDPGDFAAATPPTDVHNVSLDEGKNSGMNEENAPRVLTVLAAAMIIVFSIMTFAGLVGGRVTEEKSSRVVEIILSSVRPVDFLAGKIIANCLVGFVSTVLVVAGALISLKVTGMADSIDLDIRLIAVMLVGEILGLLFFSSLYAAAGSLVQRTEDLQSTAAPIMLFVFATVYIPMFGWMKTDATWMHVMGWVPPVSTLVAPLEVAAGEFSWLELGLSYLVLAAATALIIWIVARIYRRAILNNGKKLTWRQALTN